MIFLTFFLAGVGYLIAHGIVKRLDSDNRDSKVRYERPIELFKISFAKGVKKVLGTLSLAALVLGFIKVWLTDYLPYAESLESAVELEEAFRKIEEVIKPFKLSVVTSTTLLVSITVISSLFAYNSLLKFRDGLKKYNKAVSLALYFFTVLTSFTFLGASVKEMGENRLEQVRLKLVSVKSQEAESILNSIEDHVAEQIVYQYLSHVEVATVMTEHNELQAEVAKIETQALKAVLRVDYRSIPTYRSIKQRNNLVEQLDEHIVKPTTSFERDEALTKSFDSDSKTSSTYKVFLETDGSVQKSKANLGEVIGTSQSQKSKLEMIMVDLVKGGYSSVTKVLLESLKEEQPFLHALIKPLVAKPIEDLLADKTQKIFAASMESTGQVERQLSDLNEFVNPEPSLSQELDKTRKQFYSLLTDANRDAQDLNTIAVKKLKELESNRWEAKRIDFYQNLKNGKYDGTFNLEQRRNFYRLLQDWQVEKERSKYEWYISSTNDSSWKESKYEKAFYDFIEFSGVRKACWGFILQQEDWDGFERFFHDESGWQEATGQPVFLLNYYYIKILGNDNGWKKGDKEASGFDTFYSDDTNYNVGVLCPKH